MPQPEAQIRCEVHRPWTRIEPIDRRGHVGVFDGDTVRFERLDGTTIRTRQSARAALRRPRQRWVRWDALDLTYFLGYALWNYLTLPALLLREDIEWTELEDGVLASRFPPEVPTHGQRQRHVFDRESGLLLRYDYRPEVVVRDPDVEVANVVLERGSSGGIPYEARRRVLTMDEHTREPRSWPTVIEMRFWDWHLI